MQEDRNIKNIALFGDREADAGSWFAHRIGGQKQIIAVPYI